MKIARSLPACLVLALPLFAAPAPRTVSVLTRNVYPGLDDASGVVAAVLDGDGDRVMSEVERVWQQVVASDIPLRVSALAEEIAAKKPALVGLQEAALWRTQYPADGSLNAHHVVYDMVGLLLHDLRARGLRYEVVAESRNLDMELPRLNPDRDGNADPEDVRWTDRDVLLARADTPTELLVTSARSGSFATRIDFGGGLAIKRGWVSADVRIGGTDFRVVSGHLEDMDPDIRMAQAQELLAAGSSSLPTIFLGDYNSDANGGVSPEAYEFLLGAGLADAWRAAHPDDPGFTCCHDPLLVSLEPPLDQRVDLALYRGPFEVAAASLVGADPSDRVAGLWPSDHAGLAVTFRLPH